MARITDNCELVGTWESGLGVEPGSQVAGDRISKISPAALADCEVGANAANSDHLRTGANCELPAQIQTLAAPQQ